MRKHVAFTCSLFVVLPVIASADLNGTQTLPANSAFSFATGAITSAAADVLWTGSNLVPQGSATAYNLGTLTDAQFLNLMESAVAQIAGYSQASIPASQLALDDVFAVHTNSGAYAKVVVIAVSGTSITIRYTMFAAVGTLVPGVSAIQNNYSNISEGFPNYGIAPGSLFIVKGTGLADASASATPLQSTASPGLPLSLNGASAAVTVNGVTTHPGLYYAIANQLALVLPSSTPTGTGTLTVTYNDVTSTPVAIEVVPMALGLDGYYGTGSGLAAATSPLTGAVYSYSNSAKPGETVVLWGSGLGAIAGDSDLVYTPRPHAASVPLQVLIGGIPATVAYQGDSGFPGLNQINVIIPPGVETGCNVSLVAISGSMVSNSLTLPVAPSGGMCSDPTLGMTGVQIQSLSDKNTVNTGLVAILETITPTTSGGATQTNSAQATFSPLPGSTFRFGSSQVSLGSCVTRQVAPDSAASTASLDAGAITIMGPSGTATISGQHNNTAQLSSGFIPATGGSFSAQGAGGQDVGSFAVSLMFPTPAMTWTNTDTSATINRALGLTVTWAGGAPNSFVAITGGVSANVSGRPLSASFTCVAPTAAGQFTIPPAVLLGLPAGAGTIAVSNNSNFRTFTASGLDFGLAFAGMSEQINTIYQ